MTRFRRLILVMACLLACASAFAQDGAQWGATRYVRLSPDRIVVFAKGATFDLQRDAAWDIPDSKQKLQFQNWVHKANLAKDPGRFVADLPPDREVPLGGEVLVGSGLEDDGVVYVKLKDGQPQEVLFGLGAGIDARYRDTFKIFAEKLHTTTPTLLLLLSGKSKSTEWQACDEILDRAKTGNGYVTLLSASKVAVWTHVAPAVPHHAAPADKPVRLQAGSAASKPSEQAGSAAWILPVVGGGALVLIGALFAIPGVRTRFLGSTAKPSAGAFPVGSHERELILKVREEGQRKPPPLNAPYSVEEYAVGMVLDKYQGYDTIAQERDRAQKQADALQSYKQYQGEYEAFEKRYVAATEALKKRESELAAEQKARKDLQAKLNQAETFVNQIQQEQAQLAKSLEDAESLLRETSEWSKSVTDRLNAQAAKIHHE